MTCIVGIKSKDGIYIGGDSAVSTGDLVQTLVDPKVWKKLSYNGPPQTKVFMDYSEPPKQVKNTKSK